VRDTYHKFKAQVLKIRSPSLEKELAYLGLMRDHGIFEVRSQEQEKLPEFDTLDYPQRLGIQKNES